MKGSREQITVRRKYGRSSPTGGIPTRADRCAPSEVNGILGSKRTLSFLIYSVGGWIISPCVSPWNHDHGFVVAHLSSNTKRIKESIQGILSQCPMGEEGQSWKCLRSKIRFQCGNYVPPWRTNLNHIRYVGMQPAWGALLEGHISTSHSLLVSQCTMYMPVW